MNSLLVSILTLLVFVALLKAVFFGGSATYRYKTTQIMTANESEFFGRLVRAVPGWHVFPQVAMSALVAPESTNKNTALSAFRRISQKRVDYAIYTDEMKLVCIVELDDNSYDARKDAARDKIFNTAGIQTVRWHSRKRPSEIEIKVTLQKVLEQKG